ncbi:MAG: hypothetical protein P1U40_04550 [Coxiellaceae bacterium]|nr:hypothetical protein [Coxiellaceae bacterium]
MRATAKQIRTAIQTLDGRELDTLTTGMNFNEKFNPYDSGEAEDLITIRQYIKELLLTSYYMHRERKPDAGTMKHTILLMIQNLNQKGLNLTTADLTTLASAPTLDLSAKHNQGLKALLKNIADPLDTLLTDELTSHERDFTQKKKSEYGKVLYNQLRRESKEFTDHLSGASAAIKVTEIEALARQCQIAIVKLTNAKSAPTTSGVLYAEDIPERISAIPAHPLDVATTSGCTPFRLFKSKKTPPTAGNSFTSGHLTIQNLVNFCKTVFPHLTQQTRVDIIHQLEYVKQQIEKIHPVETLNPLAAASAHTKRSDTGSGGASATAVDSTETKTDTARRLSMLLVRSGYRPTAKKRTPKGAARAKRAELAGSDRSGSGSDSRSDTSGDAPSPAGAPPRPAGT